MSNKTFLVCGMFVSVLGVITKTPLIIISGMYLSLSGIVADWYVKNAVKHLNYCRKSNPPTAFVGDSVKFTICVENHKLLPVFWLKCDDIIPDDKAFENLPLTPGAPGRAILSNTMHLKWFEKVERTFNISCVRRGVFNLGPVKLTVGDPLGLKTLNLLSHKNDSLTVYPQIFQIKGLPLNAKSPFGLISAKGWLHPDPLSIAGTREYDGQTPINQIAWKATAKAGQLQVKVLEPTNQSKLLIALNLSTCEYLWEGIDSQSLEDVIAIAASICNDMLKIDTPFGIVANSLGTNKGSLFIAPGLSKMHLKQILEALARITLPWMPFSKTLKQIRYNIGKDTTILVILPHMSQADCECILSLANEGFSIIVLLVHSPKTYKKSYVQIAKRLPVYMRVDLKNQEQTGVIIFDRIN